MEPSEFFIDVCKAFKDDPEPAETEGVGPLPCRRLPPNIVRAVVLAVVLAWRGRQEECLDDTKWSW